MIKGGLHADYITRQITNFLANKLNLEPNDIKSYLWVFVNAHIDNPAFDSQTKGKLTVGSTCELTPEFLKNIADSLEDLFKKNNAGKLNIPKLQDAKLANTPYSQLCTLIITKGDFATDFVRSGLGEDNYGVFPLEGELLNVREASPQELEKNTDIQNIKKILGLQDGKIYENTKELRYGHLMIMADEDHDGLRIKGLLINFLHYFWPSLLKVKNFMKWFIVPTVKVCHKRTNKVFLFYTMSQYKAWKEKFGSQFNIMFKELGTIESEGEYNFDQHIKDFVWDNDEDGDTIELAFSNMKIEDRKHWLQASEDGTHLDLKEKGIRYRDFMNKEFKQCAMADLQRSIPSMLDGLKPRERKILFYALKKPIIQEIGVGEFSTYVFGHSRYHDGEVTLVDTIIGMAQNYVGSNNINLLQPNAQFGTRYLGGKDHADETLLFTRLSPITRYLFHENDELLLNYFEEDGQSIEPAWFIPIIPMVLVNGSEARGAWSSFIPNYNPRDIIANLIRLLKGQEMVTMLPWYKGFKGEILKSASNEYTTYGIKKDKDGLTKDAALTKDGLTKDAALTVTVTELPVRSWTQDYMEFLEAASRGGKDIKDYKAYDGDSSVRFEITMTEDQMNKAEQEGILKYLKLTTTLSTANMYVFDADGKLKKYDTPEKLLEDFYGLRLVFYESRKTSLLQELKIALLKLENKERFVREVWNGALDLSKKRKNEMCVELKKKGFKSSPSIGLEARKKPQEEEDVAVKGYAGYDYLLSNPILDDNDIQELEKERERTEKELTYLNDSTAESLWKKDLAALDKQLAFEEYPLEAKYSEAENKARAKRAGDAAAGQSTNKKRRLPLTL